MRGTERTPWESLLESLSLAVAELTGLAPTASYYAVLVAIVVIALVVLGGLVCLAEWLDVPQSFEKAGPRRGSRPLRYFGAGGGCPM